MAAIHHSLPIAFSIALAGIALASPAASAQGALGKEAAATRASIAPTPIRNTWICLSGMRLEVMPVSHDVSDAPEEWVLVYKQNGHPISAQKISASEARTIPTIDCGPEQTGKGRGGATLVG